MSENYLFTIRDANAFDACSTHFGVSVDNYISSMPLVGMEAVNITQRGLAIELSRLVFINAKVLFNGAYDSNSSTDTTDTPGQSRGTYLIPDEVCEFAASRNIEPLVVARVGSNLLSYVSSYKVPLEKKMPVVRYDNNPYKGKLDSFLKLSISPLNTIVPSRQKPTITEKFSHKLT